MSQPMVPNMNMNGMNPSDTKEQPEKRPQQCDKQGVSQPNVRHIPIFVEGRDQPLLNKNVNRSSGSEIHSAGPQSPPMADFSKPGSIFSRVKDIPVRSTVPDYTTANMGRTASPSRPINIVHTTSQNEPPASSQRQTTPQPEVQKSSSREHTIPIKVEHTTTTNQNNTQRGGQQSQAPQRRQYQQQQPTNWSHPANLVPQHHPQQQQPQQQGPPVDETDSKLSSLPSAAVQQQLDAISKIQQIQKDVLELMNRVEQFKGGSRQDKEYLYLDEMLTRNLLKLDSIDADGKDNIKAARKEAIKCINKCISVLEAKTDLANQSGVVEQQNQQEQHQNKHQQQVDNS